MRRWSDAFAASRFADAEPCLFRGRFDGVAHCLAALGFVDEGLPVQGPGEMGLRGGGLLCLEVVEALQEEGAKVR